MNPTDTNQPTTPAPEPSTPAPAAPEQAPAPVSPEPSAAPTQPQPQPTQQDGKDWLVALLLSLFLGNLGVDRFYMGYIGLGILKLVTFGACGIWTIIDFILIATNKLNDAQGRPLVKKN